MCRLNYVADLNPLRPRARISRHDVPPQNISTIISIRVQTHLHLIDASQTSLTADHMRSRQRSGGTRRILTRLSRMIYNIRGLQLSVCVHRGGFKYLPVEVLWFSPLILIVDPKKEKKKLHHNLLE